MSDFDLPEDAVAAPPRRAKQPTRRVPLEHSEVQSAESDEVASLRAQLAAAERAEQALFVSPPQPPRISGDHVQSTVPQPERVVNPYAASGWGRRGRTEFDVELPSGRLCRIMRLERDDLLRLNLMQYLDTFTPMLMEDTISDEERQEMMSQEVKDNPEALGKMLKAIDKIVMAATVKPQVTDNEKLVNYGTQTDWENPDFVPVAFIEDIDTFERMYIFGAAFGRSMDDLKSVLREQENGMASLGDNAGVRDNAE